MAGSARNPLLGGQDPPWLSDFLTSATSSGVPVLLRGESGTGKTILARRIHSQSPRRAKPLLELDCAGLSAAQLESELFGHEAGALTGAAARKRGLVEAAAGGGLLLEEIGALDPLVQPKLLRLIESGRFRRVGGTSELQADVRVIATTTRDLLREVEIGRFREDLYYRLGVLELKLWPLRDREAELAELARVELAAAGRRLGRSRLQLETDALEVLRSFDWPGNLRQLAHVLERAAVGGPDEITGERLREVLPRRRLARGSERVAPVAGSGSGGGGGAGARERGSLLYLLGSVGFNMRQAAKQLGVSRTTLYQRVRELGIDIQAGRIAAGRADDDEAPDEGPGGGAPPAAS